MLTSERSDPLSIIDALTPDEWLTPTAAPGWRVKDLALHLLDHDLGWLSRGRDGYSSGLLNPSDYPSFVVALGAKNQRWVDGAQGLSRRVIVELLDWAGAAMDAHYATMDLNGRGGVVWAGPDPVPSGSKSLKTSPSGGSINDRCAKAISRVTDADPYLPEVLRTFVWAIPHQYRVNAVTVDVEHHEGRRPETIDA